MDCKKLKYAYLISNCMSYPAKANNFNGKERRMSGTVQRFDGAKYLQ